MSIFSKQVFWDRLVRSQVALASRLTFDEKQLSADDTQLLNAIIRRIHTDIIEFLQVLETLDKKYTQRDASQDEKLSGRLSRVRGNPITYVMSNFEAQKTVRVIDTSKDETKDETNAPFFKAE